MPTRDRRSFVTRAIEYFLRQDYSDRELVIVDDGEGPVEDLVPVGDMIRYVWLERRLVLGEKRNVVNDLTEGEILMHWDDDWSASDRISRQAGLLQATGADLCGAGDQVYYRPSTDRAWRYRYPQRDCWVAGNTLCYLRSRWEEHPFEPVPEGEDNRFVGAGRRPVEVAGVFHIGILHSGNASPKRTYGSRWSPEPAATVHRHLGPDLALYR